MSRRRAYALVATVAVVPRLVVLLHERGDILASFTEKSDDFAQTFVDSGTFGFIPGEPSAWTQPLYSFFLIPIYWIVGREWWAVGLAQIVVAAATALLVYEIGRRFLSPRAGLIAALIATLNPYLVWHDVHVNREILDELLAAVVVYLTLLADRARDGEGSRCRRCSASRSASRSSATRGSSLLPLVSPASSRWRLRRWVPALHSSSASARSSLLPWLVRNDVYVGCFTLTTDARALWKANNLEHVRRARRGGWIDDVPNLAGAPPSPELAADLTQAGTPTTVDECAQMRLYRREVLDFWRDHPGEKATPRRPGGADAVGPALDPDRGPRGGGRLRRRRADVGPAALHDPALRARAARPLS